MEDDGNAFEDGQIRVGVWVEVRNDFNEHWAPGFVVDDVGDGGYRLKRVRDGQVLPELVPAHDVRPIRRMQ